MSRLSRLPAWRVLAIGALVPPALAALGTGATAIYWPDGAALGTVARIAESLVFHFLALAMLLGLAVLGLGARRLGLLLCALVVAAALWTGGRHLWFAQAFSDPPPATDSVELRVLWFNMLSTNRHPMAEIAAALGQSGADVVVLGEAAPFADALEPLRATYPHRLGCGPDPCGSLMFSKLPLRDTSVPTYRGLGPGRTLKAQVDLPGGQPLSLLAVHVVKPWFYGLTEVEEWLTFSDLRDLPTPLVLMGDFNAAPWSQRLTTLFLDCAIRPAPFPPATWPARAGAFGVPIDHILTRGGPVITSLKPWGGQALGSNHRGLLATISVPTSPGAPPDCNWPRTHFDAPAADRLQ